MELRGTANIPVRARTVNSAEDLNLYCHRGVINLQDHLKNENQPDRDKREENNNKPFCGEVE